MIPIGYRGVYTIESAQSKLIRSGCLQLNLIKPVGHRGVYAIKSGKLHGSYIMMVCFKICDFIIFH